MFDIINTESEVRGMKKIKEQYVLVTTYDRNNKPHFTVCENMEVAKENFSKDTQKQYITMIVR
jgi:hypothetical protein